MRGISISESTGSQKAMIFSPPLSFLLSQPGGGGRLGVRRMGTAAAAAPALAPALGGRRCRSENILLPQALTLLSFSSLQSIFVSTKGKLFTIPWEKAGPGRGQRGALASRLPLRAGKKLSPRRHLCPGRDPATFPRVNPSPANTPAPPAAPREERWLCTCVSPPRCRAAPWVPVRAAVVGAGWAPSISPPGLSAGSSGAEGKRDGYPPPPVWVPPCFICKLSIGKQGFCVCFFGRVCGQGRIPCLLGRGAVPLPRRLPSRFSVWRQRGKICPPPRSSQHGGGCSSSPAAPPLPPVPLATRAAEPGAAAASHRVPAQCPAHGAAVGTGPGGAEWVTGADSPSLSSPGNGLRRLPAFSLPEALSTGLEKINQS